MAKLKGILRGKMGKERVFQVEGTTCAKRRRDGDFKELKNFRVVLLPLLERPVG